MCARGRPELRSLRPKGICSSFGAKRDRWNLPKRKGGATLWKDEVVKLVEYMGMLRRDLRGVARGEVFVCGFALQFVVVVIK